MIQIEDANNETYHINPKQVIYVKERMNGLEKIWKILLSNGEILMTKNKHGAQCIIASIKL
jgi:hypothetical protein